MLDVIEDEGLVDRVGRDRRDDPRPHARGRRRWPRSATCAASARCSRSSSSRTGDEGARDGARRGVVEEALARGLLLLQAGVHGNCIRVLVPLVISDAELDEALDVWEDALEAVL